MTTVLLQLLFVSLVKWAILRVAREEGFSTERMFISD